MTEPQQEPRRIPPKPILTHDDAVLAAKTALDKKAADVVLLTVTNVVTYADYILLCSGRATTQVKAIAAEIEQTMKQRGIRPLHIEGITESRWVLMDYDDVIIHVFLEEARHFYNLERLWGDVPRQTFHEAVADSSFVLPKDVHGD